jgi:hypothetical protein
LVAAVADAALTAQVVETAACAAPESLRLVGQCAIAIVPESLGAVQSVLAKLEPGGGESGTSAKSGKEALSAKDSKSPAAAPMAEEVANPLDLPITTPLPPPPIIVPPIINPPDEVTDVNP